MTAARVPRLIFGLSLVVPLAAFAQSASEDYALAGAGLRARPAYDGAASERGELVPVLRYYGRSWFARTTQGILEGGARTELARGLNLGAQLAYEGGRLQRESAFLRGHNLVRFTGGLYDDGRLAAGVFAQATWANAKSTRSFYGVTPQQSTSSGLPAFEPGGGLLFTGVGLLWLFNLSREWVLLGSAEARHLRGDAARSPLAEDPSSYYASAGLAYRF